MKQYLLFAFDDYYPGGGWTDFIGSYETLEEAMNAYKDVRRDYFQVVDLKSGIIVA